MAAAIARLKGGSRAQVRPDVERGRSRGEVYSLPKSMRRNVAAIPIANEIAAVRARLRSGGRFVVDPLSPMARGWDVLIFVALVVTATVTPIEVGFLEESYDALFVVNRFLDAALFCDMVLQFFLAYHDETRGNILIRNSKLISKRYASSWFLTDLVSVIPFDVMASSKNLQNRHVKMLRMLRLVKLTRIVRFRRLLRRWELHAAFKVSYATLGIINLTVMMALFAHWSACLWGLAAHPLLVGEDTWSWIREREFSLIDRSTGKRLFNKGSATEKYSVALYFSVYTMTGLGYGDIVATSHFEVVVCVIVMVLSAVFWAFIIGSFCSIVASRSMQESLFRQRMDDVNFMMAEREFPQDLRKRCRLFLVNSRHHQRAASYNQLESLFSLALRGDVAVENNASWIRRLWYLKDASKDFVIEVSQSLNSFMFAPMEAIDVALSLFVLQNGLAAYRGRIFSSGSLWGTEFIMADVGLIDQTCAAALSYALVMCLSRDDFYAILEDPAFADERELVSVPFGCCSHSFRRSREPRVFIRFGRVSSHSRAPPSPWRTMSAPIPASLAAGASAPRKPP